MKEKDMYLIITEWFQRFICMCSITMSADAIMILFYIGLGNGLEMFIQNMVALMFLSIGFVGSCVLLWDTFAHRIIFTDQ